MAEEALKKVEEQLLCSICLETYKEPKLLQCFHVYCMGCIVRLVVKDQQEAFSLRCPSCRQATTVPSNGVSGLQAAFHINNLLEIRDDLRKARTSSCHLQAGVGGGASHVPELVTENLQSLDVPSLNFPDLPVCCSKHCKELELFCESCNELVCLRCVVQGASHHSHSFAEVGEVFQRYREEINASIKPMVDRLAKVRRTITKLDSQDQETHDRHNTLTMAIHKSVKQLHEVIEDRRIELLTQLNKLAQGALDYNAAQRDKLGIIEAQMKSCLGFMDCLKVGSQGDVLCMRVPIMKKVEQLASEFPQNILQVSSAEAVGVAFLTNPDVVSVCQSFGMLSTQYHVTGKGLEGAVTGEKLTAIITNSTFGDEHDGDDISRRLECTLISEITSKQVAGDVEALDGNRYKISYEAINKGRHQVHIKVDGIHISESPFSVMIRTSPENKIESSVRTIGPLRRPCGIAFTKDGDLVITGDNQHTVSIYGLNGIPLRSFGMQGSGKGQLLYPRGLAVTGNGDFVIADSSNHRISIFSHDGQFVTKVGRKGTQSLCFNSPKDVAWNPKTSQLYIVDSNHRVQVLNSDFTFSAMFGKFGKKPGHFNDPYGIACDSAGCVYVADTMNDRIQVFTSDRNFLREIVLGDGVCVHYPVGVAVDSKQLVYVSEYCMNRVTVYTSEGSFVTSFGKKGTSPNDFRYPRGIVVDESGVICVCDYENDRVSIF